MFVNWKFSIEMFIFITHFVLSLQVPKHKPKYPSQSEQDKAGRLPSSSPIILSLLRSSFQIYSTDSSINTTTVITVIIIALSDRLDVYTGAYKIEKMINHINVRDKTWSCTSPIWSSTSCITLLFCGEGYFRGLNLYKILSHVLANLKKNTLCILHSSRWM